MMKYLSTWRQGVVLGITMINRAEVSKLEQCFEPWTHSNPAVHRVHGNNTVSTASFLPSFNFYQMPL